MIFVSKWISILSLACTLVVSAAWFWIMPAGFPVPHPRFFSNTAVPLALIVATVSGLGTILLPRPRLTTWLIPIPTFLIIGGCIATRLLFPLSGGYLWLYGLLVGIILLPFILCCCRTNTASGRIEWSSMTSALSGTLIGVGLVFTQRAPLPTTSPSNPDFPRTKPGSAPLKDPFVRPGLRVDPARGEVSFRHHHLRVEIQPFLTFISISPDRCWTVLAPNEMRTPPLGRITPNAAEANLFTLVKEGPHRGLLRVQSNSIEKVELDAFVQLDRTVYSHLNHWCLLTIRGHKRLSVAFSPCPQHQIEILPFDYPVGRPSRFAFIDQHEQFQIMEANSGEKGPFKVLASGHLGSSAPLTLTLFDEAHAMVRISFLDWTSQASTELSPTAGYGVPQNAIEFMREGEKAESPCAIFITLAATSVGRGWDSVGHRAGVYRNRIRIEGLESD